jgi:hypothetical protein
MGPRLLITLLFPFALLISFIIVHRDLQMKRLQTPPAVFALLLLVWACARSGDVPREPSDEVPAAEPDRQNQAVAPEMARPPHPLEGTWELAFATAARATPGLRLSARVDSGGADGFYGRVTHFFSGNVGIDPGLFRPFRGTLSDGVVDLAVEPATSDAPRLHFVGRLSGDTIQLQTFTIGRDTVEASSGRSFLIRRP